MFSNEKKRILDYYLSVSWGQQAFCGAVTRPCSQTSSSVIMVTSSLTTEHTNLAHKKRKRKVEEGGRRDWRGRNGRGRREMGRKEEKILENR